MVFIWVLNNWIGGFPNRCCLSVGYVLVGLPCFGISVRFQLQINVSMIFSIRLIDCLIAIYFPLMWHWFIFLILLFFWELIGKDDSCVCVCVCVCVHVNVWACVYTFMFLCRWEVVIICLSLVLSTLIFWARVLVNIFTYKNYAKVCDGILGFYFLYNLWIIIPPFPRKTNF